MYYPSLDEAKKLSEGYTVIPVCCEIFSDIKTPIAVLKSIKAISSRYYLLESVEGSEKWGRYSFLGFNPMVEVTCKNSTITVKRGEEAVTVKGNPNETIRKILAEYTSPKLSFLPPFTGGFVGYFSYDYYKYNEPSLKLEGDDTAGFYDVDLMLFDKVIAFDHFKQKIIVMVNIKTDDIETNYNRAAVELQHIVKLIKSNIPYRPSQSKLLSSFTATMSKEEYCEKVEAIKHHIVEGDIFQAVLSNRLTAHFEGSLFDTYRVLRTSNPSPYMFFIKTADVELTGASPETLVKLKDGSLSTYPIAGTRPRGKSDEEDAQLIKELLLDEKELSEHNMLVDLGRNDLGKISEFGSVCVKDYLSIRKYSHVIHIESMVESKLNDGFDQLDAIAAVLPAGTLSGAPKIRACQIINEQEGINRGVYGGAIGYIDFSGNMDVCIAIRTAVLKDGKVYVQSGGGIVADSVPEKEYEEAQNKAKAMINALTCGKEID